MRTYSAVRFRRVLSFGLLLGCGLLFCGEQALAWPNGSQRSTQKQKKLPMGVQPGSDPARNAKELSDPLNALIPQQQKEEFEREIPDAKSQAARDREKAAQLAAERALEGSEGLD